jgi:hypothetical protein
MRMFKHVYDSAPNFFFSKQKQVKWEEVLLNPTQEFVFINDGRTKFCYKKKKKKKVLMCVV